MIDKVKAFFKNGDLWRRDLSTFAFWARPFVCILRFCWLTVQVYFGKASTLHASALTYVTMLAIVPVFALGLTSLKAFGAGDVAEEKILSNIDFFVGQMEQSAQPVTAAPGADAAPVISGQAATSSEAANALRGICKTVFNQIDSINFAKMGMIGAAVLIFMVISVLGKVESSFNAIWGIEKGRPIWRKFTDYLSVIIVAPLLVLAATSLPILTSLPENTLIAQVVNSFGIFNTLVSLFMGTMLFAFLFSFLPNTRVKISSCFLGAFVTTCLLALFFKLCFVLQVGVANNSRLYGSLIALPILLFWIYSSWQIILLGAEICYVHQHHPELVREKSFEHPSERDRIFLALSLVIWAARSVAKEHKALSVECFSNTFNLPQRDINRVASILERQQILLPVAENGSTVTTGYVLSRCATHLTVTEVINACLDDTDGEDVEVTAAEKHLAVVTALGDRLSGVLKDHFGMTIAEAIEHTEEA